MVKLILCCSKLNSEHHGLSLLTLVSAVFGAGASHQLPGAHGRGWGGGG